MVVKKRIKRGDVIVSESTLIIFATTAAINKIAAITLGIVVSRKFNDNEDDE